MSPNTIRAYQLDLDDFRTEAGGTCPVRDIGRDHIRRHAASLFDRKGLKESSARRHMAALKVMFRWLEREEAIVLSPFHNLDLSIRLPRTLPRALTLDEARKLLTLALARGLSPHSHHDDCMLAFAVTFLLATGARVSELCDLTLDRLNPTEGWALIRGKGNRERRVYLPGSQAMQVMETYLAARQRLKPAHPRLLTNLNLSPITPPHLRRLLRRLAKHAQITRPVTPHMLRHTAATQLIEAGVDIRFVQKLLGHASIATTQIYTQVSDQSLKTTLSHANAIGRIYSG